MLPIILIFCAWFGGIIAFAAYLFLASIFPAIRNLFLPRSDAGSPLAGYPNADSKFNRRAGRAANSRLVDVWQNSNSPIARPVSFSRSSPRPSFVIWATEGSLDVRLLPRS
jgi:hypothetical protein